MHDWPVHRFQNFFENIQWLQGSIDFPPFIFGSVGSKPLAGDWNGDGITTIGVFNSNTGVMSLNNNNAGNRVGDMVFNFGQNGDTPLACDWDGKPSLPSTDFLASGSVVFCVPKGV